MPNGHGRAGRHPRLATRTWGTRGLLSGEVFELVTKVISVLAGGEGAGLYSEGLAEKGLAATKGNAPGAGRSGRPGDRG
jgi:hypothetical protein